MPPFVCAWEGCHGDHEAYDSSEGGSLPPGWVTWNGLPFCSEHCRDALLTMPESFCDDCKAWRAEIERLRAAR